MRWLRQSTATQEVVIGPFVDDTDYVTAETGLTIANTDIKLVKADTTTQANKNSGGATHLANGMYYLTLDATDTATDGILDVSVKVAGALLVRECFMVLSGAGYDAIIADSGAGLVADVWNVSGSSEDIATATALATVDSNVDAVLVDTATTIPASLTTIDNEIATIDGIVDAILVDTGTTIPATLTTIDTVVDRIEVDTQDLQTQVGTAGAGLTGLPTVDANVTQTAGVTILTDGQGRFLTDVRKLHNSTTASVNLSAMFDGTTGYIDDAAPATQAQIGNIANVGAATNKPAASYTLTTGTQSSGTYASTAALDGTPHTHTSTAGAMDLYYEFLIGSGVPTDVVLHTYLTSSNDDLEVHGYDWVSAGWVQIGVLAGKNASTYETDSYPMFIDMVGTGADEGKVRVRLTDGAYTLTSATLAIDQIYLSFSQGVEGYDNGSIWVDTNLTNTNTEVGVDGTARNPVSTIAAAQTLAASTNLHSFWLSAGSSVTLASTHSQHLMNGHGWTVALGGQDIDETHFFNAAVSGVATAANEMEFHHCEIGTASLQKAHCYDCTFDGTVTWTLAGDYHVINSQSGVAGSGSPTFTKTAGQAITGEFRRWSGGLTFSGIESGDVLTIGGEMGTITLNGADGDVEIRGTYKAIVDNRTGSPTLNTDGAIKGADVASILADTNELQTDDVPGLIAALNDITVADLLAGAISQPANGDESFTGLTVEKVLGLVNAWANNKKTLNRSTGAGALRNEADSADIVTWTASDDGTTYTDGVKS